MQELIDKLLDDLRGAWRFHRIAIVVAWTVCLVGWLGILLLPDMYEARARVFVDTRTALKPLLQGLAIDQDVNAQINFVRQSLLSSPQLEKVARSSGMLDATVDTPEKRAQIIDDLRTHITLTVVSAAEQGSERETSGGTIYAIQYLDKARPRALQVVETLLNTFVEDTLGGKRQGSQNAQKFLQDQIRDYEQRLRASEDRLAAFKKTNVGLMPTEQGDYFSRLQNEIDAASKVQGDLALAQARRTELGRQLRGDETLAATSASPGGLPGAPAANDTLSRIKETQTRLDELLLRYTDRHPDVIAQKETLGQLKQRRQSEIEALRRGDPNAAAASGASSNPVYQSIQLSLNQADVEVASLRRQLSDHQSKVAELRARLDTMPQVEAEYARLNRDYDVTKTQYTALVDRLDKSRLGEEADTSGSVKFNVIDPPAADFQPVSPKRALLVIGVLAAGIGLGIGVAYLLHLLRPVFNLPRALSEATGLPVLGVVSLARLAQHQSTRRRSYLWCSAGLLLLVVVGIAVLKLNLMGIRLSPHLASLV
jgi:polysaccharide chain length determinant protein (PEP-CTERM system associated)